MQWCAALLWECRSYKSRNNARTHTHSQIPQGEALRRRLHVRSLYICLAMHFCGSSWRWRWTWRRGNVVRGVRDRYTVGTQWERVKCTHWGAVQWVCVWSPRAAENRQTHSEKHVDIANNTANTQRNLRLTITTGACDCTVLLEVTRVEATPRKTFSTQNRLRVQCSHFFGLIILPMPCPWERPRPIQPGQNVVSNTKTQSSKESELSDYENCKATTFCSGIWIFFCQLCYTFASCACLHLKSE